MTNSVNSQRPESSENTRIARAAGVVGSATMLSRVLGYVRDMVIALFFGAGPAADAFFVAFRIPNMLRRLLGEGSLTVSFIPVFTETLDRQGEQRAKQLTSAAFSMGLSLLVLLTVLGIWLAPWLVRVISPGFGDDPLKFALTVNLLRLMFPFLIFVSLVALCMGVLNSLGHFAAPALAPVALNICMILGMVGLGPLFGTERIYALAIGVLVGGVAQLALQLPFLAKRGFLPRPSLSWNLPELRKIGMLMLPAIFGLGVTNLNVMVNTFFASLLREGSVSFLYYADRIMELPLGIFGVAIGTAALPAMSRQISANDLSGMKGTLNLYLRIIIFITLPAALGLIMLREPIVAVLFQRREFDDAATQATALALACYAVGLVAFSALRIVVPAFYAMKDTLTPVLCAAAAFFANIVCGLCFIGRVPYVQGSGAIVGLRNAVAWTTQHFSLADLDHGGLALGASAAAFLNLGLLLWILRRRVGRLGARLVLGSTARIALACVPLVLGCWGAQRIGLVNNGRGFLFEAGGLLLTILAALVLYAGAAALLLPAELGRIIQIVSRRLRRRP
ncbi:MAG: murein biosynthesis integral membrane protein MurJ [Candidatus Alcyoniella australis]|nr:murein biosynthesis integral membrane protein MurJ [Candidatus Alcyoniella australis]